MKRILPSFLIFLSLTITASASSPSDGDIIVYDGTNRWVTSVMKATIPTTQTIAATNTITVNACGGMKQISSAGAVTTNTTNTFTAPAAANSGCSMDVCNVGANDITLDANANFITAGAADVVLTANDCVRVASNGSNWYQVSPVSVN